MSKIDELLANLYQLPTIPAVVQELIASFGSADLDTVVLARKIGQDPGLAAKVLRVANSAFYSLPRQVGSIQDAVVVLGFNTVRSLVMAVSFINVFPAPEQGGFDRREFWKRSMRVGTYAKALAKPLRLDQEMAFTAGLFHDIGQVALDICLHDQFAAALEEARSSGRDLIEVEKSSLGFDHATVGAEVVKRWNFPRTIEHAIRYQHFLDAAELEPITALVYLANLLVGAFDDSAGEQDMAGIVPEGLLQHLGLDWPGIKQCLPDTGQLDAGANLLLAA